MATFHTQAGRLVSTSLPLSEADKLEVIPDQVRRIFLTAPSGWGKSLLIGRHLAWSDFYNDRPAIVFEPHGPSEDNFLHKFSYQKVDYQQRNAHRIRIIDPSGSSGFATPIPLYYKMGNESLATIATRPLDLFLKADPDLASASVQGANALIEAGRNIGMLLVAMGCQPSEALSLLYQPADWKDRLQEALQAHPELEAAHLYYQNLVGGKQRQQELRREAGTFLRKIGELSADSAAKAFYCASEPLIDWEEVVAERQIVFFDGRHLHGTREKLFFMIHCLDFVLSFVKQRGAGRHEPALSIYIDELMSFFPMVGKAAEQLALDMDALINQYARNFGPLFLCIATQQLSQLTPHPQLLTALLGMPTQIHGGTDDPLTTDILADKFFRYKDDSYKRMENQWMMQPFGGPFIVDQRPIDHTIEEQRKLNGQKFRELQPFEFYARVPSREGAIVAPLQKLTIATMDPGIYTNRAVVDELRSLLLGREGIALSEVLEDIAERAFNGLAVARNQSDDIPAYELVDSEKG